MKTSANAHHEFVDPERDRSFMRRALIVAKEPLLTCLPNPRVGAVIVSGNQIVGEGAHLGPGSAHAEVVAVQAARRNGFTDFRHADIYITLEPCSHTAKRTPPCAPLLVELGFRRVVVASRDPNPLVAGAGLQLLRQAGIAVQEDVEKEAAVLINQDFFKNQVFRRPYVTVKCALTFDGKLADRKGRSQWISSPEALADAHQLRAEADTVLVGAGTFDHDNPRLNVRLQSLVASRRVIILGSPKRRLSSSAAVKANGRDYVSLVPRPTSLKRFFSDAFTKMNAHHLLVEAGPRLLSSLLEEKLVDRLILYYGRGFVGASMHELFHDAPRTLSKSFQFQPRDVKLLSGTIRTEGVFRVYGID